MLIAGNLETTYNQNLETTKNQNWSLSYHPDVNNSNNSVYKLPVFIPCKSESLS